MRKYDIVILGGGISGLMAVKRLSMHFPALKVAIIDKKFEIQDHVFHLLSVAGAILFAMHWWSIVIDVLGGDNDNDA